MNHDGKKQRLAALRRTLGVLASPSRWIEEERARRLARLEAALVQAVPAQERGRARRGRASPPAQRRRRSTER